MSSLPPSSSSPSPSGRYILEQVLKEGLTGKVAFDENGDRINAEYDIINIQEFNETDGLKKEHVPVGQFIYNKVRSDASLGALGGSTTLFSLKGGFLNIYTCN